MSSPNQHQHRDPLTDEQITELLMPIHQGRVYFAKDGTRRLTHQDVRRRLTQIFGFTGWGEEIITNECIEERKADRSDLVILTYRAHVRLHIRDGRGGSLTFFDGIGIWDGTQRELRRGVVETITQAKHNVANGASTVGFLRAALSLGDQFGGSLHLDEPPAHGFIQGTLSHPFVPPPPPVDYYGTEATIPAQSGSADDDANSTDDEETTPDDAHEEHHDEEPEEVTA